MHTLTIMTFLRNLLQVQKYPETPLTDTLGCINLLSLNLKKVGIDDDGAAHIAKYCKKLEKLNLAETEVGDSGVAYIANHESGCNYLMELDLTKTEVGDEGLAR